MASLKPPSGTIKQVLAVPSSYFCKTYKNPPGNSCEWISFLAYEQMRAADKCLHDRYAVLSQFLLTEAAERRESLDDTAQPLTSFNS